MESFPNNSPIRNEHSGDIILFFSRVSSLYFGYAKDVKRSIKRAKKAAKGELTHEQQRTKD